MNASLGFIMTHGLPVVQAIALLTVLVLPTLASAQRYTHADGRLRVSLAQYISHATSHSTHASMRS